MSLPPSSSLGVGLLSTSHLGGPLNLPEEEERPLSIGRECSEQSSEFFKRPVRAGQRVSWGENAWEVWS